MKIPLLQRIKLRLRLLVRRKMMIRHETEPTGFISESSGPDLETYLPSIYRGEDNEAVVQPGPDRVAKETAVGRRSFLFSFRFGSTAIAGD
jgi:hypothetical protein